jgi:FAD/FMN-containing dehydrogenase
MATEIEASPETAAQLESRNWFGDLVTHPLAVVEARSIEDIVAAVGDPERHPSPVRPRGSAHSTTLCGEADGGTIVDTTRMNRILSVDGDTVTVEPGALLIDVAKELERRNLQFYVNMEVGNASMGSIACCATKDASMPGEYGQVNSYCVGMKIVTASGEVVDITDREPELLQAARSSYGLFGILAEVKFKIRPLQAMAVEHKVMKLSEFADRLPEIVARGDSVMMYMFPYIDSVAVELRRYTGEASSATKRVNHRLWRTRNLFWKSVAPGTGYVADKFLPGRKLGYSLVNGVNRTNQLMVRSMKAANTVPTDQMIRYGLAGRRRETFSIWSIPEDRYSEALREYMQFVRDDYRRTGYRPNMGHVGYRVAKDESSLLSYSYDGDVLTIDPVSTGTPGWREFLRSYNQFCSEHGGQPLLNQTWGLTPEQARRAFGKRLERFEEIRRGRDPENRFLNGFFRDLLGSPTAS